jgi:DNA-binding SARP family transcriptional activator
MEFGVLGPLQVRSDGRPVPVGAPMQRALLAALLLHANQVVSVEQLIDYLWDQTPPPSARTTLQNYILRLRRLLPERPERAGGQLLVTTAPGYLLQLRPGELDLDRFQRLVTDARASTIQGELERAAGLLRDALALWRGQPLCDVASEPLRRLHLPRLEEQRLGAVEARIDAELGLGLHAELTGELHGLVDEQPLRERFRAQLMLALYRCGRQAEALEVYRSTWRLLSDELGVQPGPDLRRLEQAILREDASLDLPAGVAAGHPPAATISPPRQLPAAITDFTGRHQHLDELDRLLGSEAGTTAVVISAIAGTAGVGKTALAVHWAHRARDRFPDGQLYVNLRGYAPTPPLRSIEALAQFLHALGVPAEQVPVDLDEAAGLYRTRLADKHILVVLDNARSADQVRPLLPGSPGCLVLVTSRDRLGGLVAIEGARRLTLDALLPEEAVRLLTRLLGAERVAAEQQAAEELAAVCGRLPLALRIAAANLADQPGRSIAEYLARLRQGDRLAELAVDSDPQAAVRTALDYSYAALDPGAQRLFRLLGLVPGPDITTDAAAALAAVTTRQAGWLLDRLAGAHLLDQHSPGRFAFHDLLRLYAAQRAHDEDVAAEREAAIQRLYDYYLHAVDAAARLLYPEMLRLALPAATMPPPDFEDHAQAMTWLDAERPNLVAAIRHAAEHGPPAPAWLLADALRGYFWSNLFMVDWLAVAHAGLAAAEAEGALRAQAAIQLSVLDANLSQGQYPSAIRHATRAATLAQQCGWLEGQTAALNKLGSVYAESGRLQEAADHYARALVLGRQTGWVSSQAGNLSGVGLAHQELGRLEQAADEFTQALVLYRDIGSRIGQAKAHHDLGHACLALGRVDEALDHLMKALTLDREIGYRSGEVDALNGLAALHRDTGRDARALELAQDARSLAEDIGERRLEAEALNTLASVDQRLARHPQAIHGHEQALRLARAIEARYPEAQALVGLAVAHRHAGQPDRAGSFAWVAVSLTRRAGFRVLEGQALTAVAAVHLDHDEFDLAIRRARQAATLQRETGHRLGEARSLLVLGHALRHTGRTDAGLRCWEQALVLFTDVGAPDADQVRDLLQTHAQ